MKEETIPYPFSTLRLPGNCNELGDKNRISYWNLLLSLQIRNETKAKESMQPSLLLLY